MRENMVSATSAKSYNHCFSTQIYNITDIHSCKVLHIAREIFRNCQGQENIKRVCEALTWKHQEPRLSVVKYHSKESSTLKKQDIFSKKIWQLISLLRCSLTNLPTQLMNQGFRARKFLERPRLCTQFLRQKQYQVHLY